jgi:hypothetical protein
LDVDIGFGEPCEVFFPARWVDEMKGLVTLLEAVLDGRAQHTMLFIDAVEEGADVTVLAENAPCKP